MEVDDVGMAHSLEDLDLLRQLCVLLLCGLEAVPCDLVALLAVDALVDNLVGALPEHRVELGVGEVLLMFGLR